ncbi:MAG: hypothetical protein HYV54_02470 [Parcubacteria group bacterium]|nr:hypothetical protein [Parcubacteria group bacterium]
MVGKSFDELTPEEKEKNRAAGADLVKDRWYVFVPPAETIPLERRINGVPQAGEPIRFSRAKYLGWREKQQEHMFYTSYGGKDYFAPMFMCGGVICMPA